VTNRIVRFAKFGGPEVLSIKDEPLKSPGKGDVRIKIYKGNVIVVGRKSPNSLYNVNLVSFDEKGDYNQKDAEGFIKINSIRLRQNRK